ncbi:hypothetical protein PAECIP111802_06897 [Paenibacillus allorhizosphaerae]|uniref:Uncharacterized protein n=1 Tax=Paenibacillus allorhizosphaerae TaxID=2849866 RepID=A0ABM8VTT5_9BACL|nr:hypothetical protein PAECIP111802_06897 [Paenibacillus allorhizosphaerae]
MFLAACRYGRLFQNSRLKEILKKADELLPLSDNCDHYYKVLLLHSRLENWELFLKTILSFRNTR